MNEEKVYTAKNKSIAMKSVALFAFAIVWFIFDVYRICNADGTIDTMSIFFLLFIAYFCFMALHVAPIKVVFQEDGYVRFTFILKNSFTVKSENFKIDGKRLSDGKWNGWAQCGLRRMFFTSDTFPELEKYLVEKNERRT